MWARFLYSEGATSKYLLKWSIKFFLVPYPTDAMICLMLRKLAARR